MSTLSKLQKQETEARLQMWTEQIAAADMCLVQAELDIIGANLRVVGDIRSGAYGTVYRTVCRRTRKHYALKRVHTVRIGARDVPIMSDTFQAMRMYREICLLDHFQHDNIVALERVMRFPADRKAPLEKVYMQMELMACDLNDILEQERHQRGLPSEHIRLYMYELLHAVKALHDAGILHGDIHPGNVCIKRDNTVAIIDLNLARHGGDGNPNTTLLPYRAPELLMRHPHFDTKIDVWSIGLVFAEMICGQRILPGWSTGDPCNDVIGQLHKVISLIGTPCPEDINEIGSRNAQQYLLTRIASCEPQDLSQLYQRRGEAPDLLALDLLKSMLTYNPGQRISVDDALRHPYFKRSTEAIPDGLFDEGEMAGVTSYARVPPVDERLAYGSPEAIQAAITDVAEKTMRRYRERIAHATPRGGADAGDEQESASAGGARSFGEHRNHSGHGIL